MPTVGDEEVREENEPEDHRVRVAEERRRRMHARLQEAVVRACTANGDFQMPSAEDICRTADVSRATFYKHFDSVPTAIDEAGQILLEEMVADVESLFDEESQTERVAIGVQLFLMRAATDPQWAEFVSRVVQLSSQTDFGRNIVRDLKLAVDTGEITLPNLDAAISLALGGLFDAIRYVHKTGDRRRDYVEGLTVMILRSFGVEEARAVELVGRKSAKISSLAPERMTWWSDPWV